MKHHSTPRRRPTPRQNYTTHDKSTKTKKHRATPRHIEYDPHDDNYQPVHADRVTRYDYRLDPSYRGNPLRLPSLIISVVAIAIAMIASVIYTTIPSEAEPVFEVKIPQNETTPEGENPQNPTALEFEMAPSEQTVSHETPSQDVSAEEPSFEESLASIENSMRESPDYTACFLALGAWEGYPGLDDIYWQVIADAGIDQSQVDASGEVAEISDYFKANPDTMQSTVDRIIVVLREAHELVATDSSETSVTDSPETS